ncbi:TonB-dependent receptor plug domain-containing protein [Celeribacter sp.]|uniref:TonB-dependent receptor plug domain-containing protein n=1 Tax=Celeribacter sp. TaxID=1890673 RepID=UPI003A8F71AC
MRAHHTSRLLRLTTAALALTTSPMLAQDTGEIFLLDEIVVSGGLTGIAKDNFTRDYSILTADALKERGITTVQDALRSLPGVSVTSTGETYTQVRMRGGEADHVLVLIDGVVANSSGSGEYLFTGLTLENIERIEVLRGPQSTLYGANAMSGVISIVTKSTKTIDTEYGGSLEVGSHDTYAGEVYLRQAGELGNIALSLGSRHTDGEDNSRSGGDTDYNDRETLSLKGEYDFSDTITAGFTLRRTWQNYGYDSPSYTPVDDPADYLEDTPDTADRNQIFGSLWLEASTLGGRLDHRFAISTMDQDSTHYSAGAYSSDDAATRHSFKYTGSYALDGSEAKAAQHKLNFSLEAERETYKSSYAAGGTYERENQSIALEYQGRLNNGLDVQSGLRHDFNDVFEDATTWNLSAAYQLPGRDIRLRAASGRAIVNPTMFEQFGYVPGTYTGNSDLKPEESLSYEIGADMGFAGGYGDLSVTLFHSKVENMISGSGDTSTNLEGTSTRKGAELSLGLQATDWLYIAANYTYTHARNSSDERLVHRPEHELGLAATTDILGGRGAITTDIRHVAGNYDSEWYNTAWPDSPEVSKLPTFTTVNLAARYDLTEHVQLNARVTNLFDETYSEAWGYYGPTRAIYVGVSTAW